jgi:hypothetical protein
MLLRSTQRKRCRHEAINHRQDPPSEYRPPRGKRRQRLLAATRARALHEARCHRATQSRRDSLVLSSPRPTLTHAQGQSLFNVQCLAHLVDDLAGIAGSGYNSSPTQVRFKSPSGRQFVDVIFSDSQRTEGTPQNGRYRSAATLPRYAEAGVWHLEYFLLVDQTGNSVYLKETDVAALGFATTFHLAE